MYTVNPANINAFGQVTARTDYINGFSHKGAADTFGANTGIAFPIDVDPDCGDGLACNGVETCDSNTKFAIVDDTHFRKGTCVPGTPVTCPQCKTCSEPSGTCGGDASQVGTPCTGPGAVECQSPVCQADGSCANQADSSKNSQTCGTDTAGDCVHPGCENGVCAPAHTTDLDDTPCTSAGGDTAGDCKHPCCEAGQCVADAPGCRDQDSTPCTDTGNELCDAGCDAGVCNQEHICQQPSVGCRITAGGVTPDGRTDPDFFGTTRKATFGGQVGAPCGCNGCFDELDHIQGEWTHVRHRRTGRLHASDYYSLVCACDEGNGTVKVDEFCGDRVIGPTPPRAPANIACWTGVGEFRNQEVAFRVEVEDRGEPGAGKNNDNTNDVYRIFIWVPTGTETADSLAKAACCLSTPPDIRRADVEDGGNIVTGNIQIHPATPNTNNGTCPVPSGTCVID